MYSLKEVKNRMNEIENKHYELKDGGTVTTTDLSVIEDDGEAFICKKNEIHEVIFKDNEVYSEIIGYMTLKNGGLDSLEAIYKNKDILGESEKLYYSTNKELIDNIIQGKTKYKAKTWFNGLEEENLEKGLSSSDIKRLMNSSDVLDVMIIEYVAIQRFIRAIYGDSTFEIMEEIINYEGQILTSCSLCVDDIDNSKVQVTGFDKVCDSEEYYIQLFKDIKEFCEQF